ncbi:MAG TPA: YciI family protein [Luteimonas sp.]|nr:YciI family protein [Luteimonas sp.]HRP73718.1 YciI family protein [Luteimonas sp.]
MTQDDEQHEFLVLSRGQWDRGASPEAIQAAIDAFYPWIEAHMAAGRMKTGQRLARGGATVSRKGFVVDGPFGETKELVGGYWFVVARTLEEAAALLAASPTLQQGLFYELRPVEAERASAYVRGNETPD